MKYKIIHPESDCEWIEDNPTEEQLMNWQGQDCDIIEIDEPKSKSFSGKIKNG